MRENVVVILFNELEYAHSTEPHGSKFEAQPSAHRCAQGLSASEHFAGAIHFELHQMSESFVVFATLQIIYVEVESRQIFGGQIHPVLIEIDCDVLPMIGELQRGADIVRPFMAL